MKRAKRHLVCQHLEGISANALEQYQDIIREYTRDRHGIYALYKRERLYYVGLATNLRQRLKQHLHDRHCGLWDRFSVYLTIGGDHIKELESLVLRITMPKGNSQKGKLPKSEDIKRRLMRDVRNRQKEELQVLVGKRVRVVRRGLAKRRDRRIKSESKLGPYVSKSFRIEGVHRGVKYRARVRARGWIYHGGYLYSCPSNLAGELCGRRINGWTFWKYERAPGDWVPLSYIRKYGHQG